MANGIRSRCFRAESISELFNKFDDFIRREDIEYVSHSHAMGKVDGNQYMNECSIIIVFKKLPVDPVQDLDI